MSVSISGSNITAPTQFLGAGTSKRAPIAASVWVREARFA
jgi:hypothetical protein